MEKQTHQIKTAVGVFAKVLDFILRNWKPIAFVLVTVFSWQFYKSCNSKKDSNDLKIMETSVIITKIKSIAELNTMSLKTEFVIDSVVQLKPDASISEKLTNRIAPKSIAIIYKGEITAGINLADLKNENIKNQHDTLILSLKKPSYNNIILNPSDRTIFDVHGNWSDAEMLLLYKKAQLELITQANNKKLITQAQQQSEMVLKNLCNEFGYKATVINWY